MSRNRQFTDEQKQHILKEVEENGLAITIRKHGLNARSIYRWRENLQHPDRRVEDRKRTPDDAELRRLRYENQQLKELIAEKELAIRIKDALLKKTTSRERTG
jgi:transposase-like protein